MLQQMMANGFIPSFSRRDQNALAVAILADLSPIKIHRMDQFYWNIFLFSRVNITAAKRPIHSWNPSWNPLVKILVLI